MPDTSAGIAVSAVVPDSIADELELRPGDRLIAVNGSPVRDLIDFHFYDDGTDLVLEVLKPDGELWELEVEREEGEPLGLIFESPEPARCGNRCVFCFVHQLPRGLRSPLYVKDEDYRLSFLYGNYVTLANLIQEDLDRIVAQRLSPLYISVHATDPDVRERLLGRSDIPPILPQLRQLAAAGIRMHTQIVLCPGWNDGEVLRRTIADLEDLYPAVASLAVVPVGLTAHRKHLPELRPVDALYAEELLREWLPEAAAVAERYGEPFLFFADEFFLKGGLPIPAADWYGDFPQVENGVGMVRLFLDEAADIIKEAGAQPPLAATVVTGVSPMPFMRDFIDGLAARTGWDLQLVAVENLLFGESVTVTGLVGGKDIIRKLKDVDPDRAVVVPDVMLKEGEGLFLDDLSVTDVEVALKRRVVVACSTPGGLFDALQELLPLP